MKNLKKLTLLTALCAIISCGGGGGTSATNGGTSASNGPTPSNPGNPSIPSVNIPVKRFTHIDISKFTEDEKDIDVDFDFVQEGSNYLNLGRNVIIGKEKYGFSGVSTIYNYSLPTTLTVKNGGVAFYYDFHLINKRDWNDILYSKSEINKETIKDFFLNHVARPENITANMEKGSIFLFYNDGWVKLSKLIEISESGNSNILSEIPYKPLINGTEYDFIKFRSTLLLIDQDINLDDDNNPYHKELSRFIGPSIFLEENKKIVGTKDNQTAIEINSRKIYGREAINYGIIKLSGKNSVAMKGDRAIFNNGIIEITGENSIAMFSSKLILMQNEKTGSIKVEKNSVGMYASDSSKDEAAIISNEGNILLGENATGMYVKRTYFPKRTYTTNLGKIESNSDNVTGITANIGDIKSDSIDPIEEVSNEGEINLLGDKSTGIYVTGKGKIDALNRVSLREGDDGKIIIGDSTNENNPNFGMYSDNLNATLYNLSIIEIGKKSIGMAGVNGGKLDNYGIITIKGDGGIGMYLADGTEGTNGGTIKTDGAGLKDVIGVLVGKGSKFTNKAGAVIDITATNGKGVVFENGAIIVNNGIIKVNGSNKVPEQVALRPVTVKVMSDRISPVKSELGIYMDSLGKTNPIEGLSNLGLDSADLLIGAEATEKTNATEVAVTGNVLDPFNKSIKESNIEDWTVKSGSLVWEAEPEIKDNNIEKVTLKKQSYAKYADEKTEEVAKALDEKYVNTGVDTRDKQIFNDMNKLRTKKELAKTYKEVSGGQYINVQQRINQTDEVLEKEITALRNDKLTEAGHHISTFAGKDNYEAKTPEIAKSKSVNYGAAYLYNDTNNGWGAYAGAVMNKFKLEDEGKSKENMTLIKAGAYKTFDLGPVDWTVGGEGNISWNEMKRRYVSLGTVYENKADYNSYGLAVKNELSKTYQLNDVFTFKPYGALKIGFGKFTDIKEKNSTLGLEIKGNSYYSVKPALGMELGLSVPVGTAAKFKAGLGLGYEHELGKIENNENEAKFISAGSSWKLKGAKDEDRGGLKSELKAGFEAGNYNIYLTGGYNTKGKNSHVGIKFGASF